MNKEEQSKKAAEQMISNHWGLFNAPEYDYDVAILKDYGNKQRLTIHKAVKNSGLEAKENKEGNGGKADNENDENRRGSVNGEKLQPNIYRAKQKIYEYASCNPWDYFVTLTIDKDRYSRTDLKTYYKKFSQWLRDYKKKYSIDIKYIFIPELHKDGESWHMHGLIYGLPREHLTINENGYLDWTAYREKFGYISIDHIHHMDRIAAYVTKYITKDLDKCVTELNAKLYYSSKGLKCATVIKRGHLRQEIPSFDYEGEFVKVKWYKDVNDLDKLQDLIE